MIVGSNETFPLLSVINRENHSKLKLHFVKKKTQFVCVYIHVYLYASIYYTIFG